MRSKKDINIEIGANIQAAREQAGYTQEHLAELLDLYPNHISAIEQGVSAVSLDALRKICVLFGISADVIVICIVGIVCHNAGRTQNKINLSPAHDIKRGITGSRT